MSPEPTGDLEPRGLSEHLQDLGEHLLAEPEFHREALEELLDEVLEDIQTLHMGYEEPAPPGGEAIQAFVAEALDLYAQCVVAMKTWLEDPEESWIRQGLEKAEEAEDLLIAVEMVIQENKEQLHGGGMS